MWVNRIVLPSYELNNTASTVIKHSSVEQSDHQDASTSRMSGEDPQARTLLKKEI